MGTTKEKRCHYKLCATGKITTSEKNNLRLAVAFHTKQNLLIILRFLKTLLRPRLSKNLDGNKCHEKALKSKTRITKKRQLK